ncbi:MAG: DUF642 domain-containing protein [Verrucomicrobiota bacterium]|nr:DUF642 domain-containing protein [Verrucomicrobiota bacterium]
MKTNNLTPLKILAASVAMACVSVAQVNPEIILRDTFNVSSATTDINFECNSRQTGSAAPVTYTASVAGTPEGLIELGMPEAAGWLRITSTAVLSPNHNFVEGGDFTIEFDLDPGINDPGGPLSGDWCAIVFGASTQGPFVNASDGMGILFRNSGDIQVFDGTTAVYGGNGGLAIPTDRPFHVKIQVSTANFRGSPANVKMFIDGQQATIGAEPDGGHVKAAGFRANYITLESYAWPGPWVDLIDNLTITATPCIKAEPGFATAVAGLQSDEITVTIPRQLNTGESAEVIVQSADPSIAVPVGADASGALKLVFEAGGQTSKTFKVAGVKAGSTTIEVNGPAGTCSMGLVQVSVSSGFGLEELVFNDNFNVSQWTYDINFENNGPRQTGSAAPLSYLENPAHAPGAAADEFTQIYSDGTSGKLMLTVTDFTWASPDYNFIDGPNFTISVKVDPSVYDPARSTADWAAIVFGATASGMWVNGSDGIGILFRSNGGYQVFDGTTLAYNGAAESLPAGELDVRIEVSAVDFSGTSPATVALFVNGAQVKIANEGMTYTKAAGFRGNRITLEGYAAAGNYWAYTFDDFRVTAMACVHGQPSPLVFGPGQTTANLTVQVPEAFNKVNTGKVRLVSRNPGVATFTAAPEGDLTLTFAAGGQAKQTVEVKAVGSGMTAIDIYNDQGVCNGDPIQVVVRRSFVSNPSFESNYNTAWPHYGAVDGWDRTGGGGVNQSDGPFHDNGAIPDRARIAFMQGNGVMSQTITGLVPNKQYWVQVRYNVRNCCGDRTVGMTVRFDGIDLGTVDNITAVGGTENYRSRNFVFTPTADTGLLEIASSVTGDGTLLIDAVTIVQRDEGNVIVQNPSFEASGTIPQPGVIADPQRISGWASEGTVGVDVGGGAYADNGAVPDQDLVGFIQGPGALSQMLTGLSPGQTYKVTFWYNAGSAGVAHLKVTAGTAVLMDADVTAVGVGNAFHKATTTFVADSANPVLRFEQTAEGTATILLDDVYVEGQAINIPCLELNLSSLQIGVGLVDSTLTVSVSPEFVGENGATVTVSSDNPAVVGFGDAGTSSVTLSYVPGGDLIQAVSVKGIKGGTATLHFTNSKNVCFNRDTIPVLVLSSFVRNPSFEDNSNTFWPGYGPLASWTSEGPGNTGTNNRNDAPANRPFLDNGATPDRDQVGFMQLDKTIRQTVVGLSPGKTYWLQFHYNARGAAAGTVLDLSVKFDGVELLYIPDIRAVGGTNPFYFVHTTFVPNASSGVLEFATTTSGDVTVLLDGVNIVQRDSGQLLVKNPSFEASGIVAFPGYIAGGIAGWEAGGGGRGVNISGVGPFADNGVNPDQDSVLFLQGQGTYVSQVLEGLTAGQNYTVSFAVNARSGNTPHLKVTFDDQVLVDESIMPVGGTNPYLVKSGVFRANGETGVLRFEQTAAGDNMVLLDDVKLVAGGTIVEKVRLNIALSGTGARIAWPASASSVTLIATDALGSPWQDVGLPVVVEGNERAVYVPVTSAMRFFALRK